MYKSTKESVSRLCDSTSFDPDVFFRPSNVTSQVSESSLWASWLFPGSRTALHSTVLCRSRSISIFTSPKKHVVSPLFYQRIPKVFFYGTAWHRNRCVCFCMCFKSVIRHDISWHIDVIHLSVVFLIRLIYIYIYVRVNKVLRDPHFKLKKCDPSRYFAQLNQHYCIQGFSFKAADSSARFHDPTQFLHPPKRSITAEAWKLPEVRLP